MNNKQWVAVWATVGLVILTFIVLAIVGGPAYSRYQKRQDRNQNRSQALLDAKNEVTINSIRIRTFEQKVKIAHQSAAIRLQNAVGVRKAQDEISSTLTPLYVQFEMVEALKQIAVSGKNSSVVYIPSGAAGIPFIQGAGPSVGGK
jgi:hypothetical protein